MLSGVVLGGTAVACAVLFLLGFVAERRMSAIATSCVCGVGALLVFVFLVAGAPPSAIDLPVGLPGSGAVLALDGLSAAFLLLVFTTGAAAAAGSLDDGHSRTGAALPPFMGGMVLTLLAGDAFSLMLGFEAMSVASFIFVLSHDSDDKDGSAALLYLGMALFATACLVPALSLLTPSGTPLGEAVQFAAMRVHPPDGLRAVAILALVLAGAGAKAGLVPLQAWLPPAHAAAPAHISALMSGAMTKVALYVMIRILFDLCGPAQPLWWSVPLLVMGATGAVLGGLRAALEGDIKTVLACSTIEHVSLIAIGFGIALAARGADLTPLAALALTAALLHIWAHGTFKALLFMCAGAVQRGAGTRSLARLGGLIHHMPVTAACALIGCASLAALPPTSGFAGEWTLFQAILGAPRIGVFAIQILVCAAAALASIAIALAGVAMIRLIGIAFLGRPRSPRAAGASEALPATRWTMLALAAVTTSIGLFPGVAVSLLEPAIRLLLRASGSPSSLLVIRPQTAAPGYAALGIAALLAIAGGAITLAYRRRTRSTSEAPAWDCGFAAPPPWMPFGDPATQYTAASFSQPIRRTLGCAILGARETLDQPAPGDTRAATFTVTLRDPSEALLFEPIATARERISAIVEQLSRLSVRRTLMVMFAALVLFLVAIAAWQQA